MNIYLIRFDSESGDHFTVGLYSSDAYPTKPQLDALARQTVESYIVPEGDGEYLYGSFDVERIDSRAVQPLPEPDGLPPLGVL